MNRTAKGELRIFREASKFSEFGHFWPPHFPWACTRASGIFKGYTWNMAANNTGRSEIVPLFEGLEDKEHLITFTVTDVPANVWVKGHTVQIFAMLSASDNKDCKNRVGGGGKKAALPAGVL